MEKRNKRFENNRDLLMVDDGYDMPQLPDTSEYPLNIKEIFKFIEAEGISADDLVELQEGETSSQSLINVYFKILEKINQALL